MTRPREFVFGYGSLTARGGPAAAASPSREVHPNGFVADLAGVRRIWGVAMDNRRDLPGYKYYRDAAGGRPGVYVAFLDLRAADGAAVNGVCLPVDEPGLAELDLRERNYERVDVSDRVAPQGTRVWAYVGSPAGRERLRVGCAHGTAVIDANYLRSVSDGFAALGEAEHSACRASLDPDGLPVVELTRHELA
jgi:hypothetical protein